MNQMFHFSPITSWLFIKSSCMHFIDCMTIMVSTQFWFLIDGYLTYKYMYIWDFTDPKQREVELRLASDRCLMSWLYDPAYCFFFSCTIVHLIFLVLCLVLFICASFLIIWEILKLVSVLSCFHTILRIKHIETVLFTNTVS